MNEAELSVQERWKRLPLAWDRERLAGTPRIVRANWLAMTWRMAELVTEHLAGRPDARLLDIGCGNGRFQEFFDPPPGGYYGIDPSPEMLREAPEPKRGGYVVGVGERLPFPDGCFAVVVLKSVLMHCFDPAAVLAEAARVLEPGGVCILSVANGRAWYWPLRRVWERSADRRTGTDGVAAHLYRLDADRLYRLLRRAEMVPVHQETLGFGVLPSSVDRRLPNWAIRWAVDWSERLGRRLCPKRGGSLILVARRPMGTVFRG